MPSDAAKRPKARDGVPSTLNAFDDLARRIVQVPKDELAAEEKKHRQRQARRKKGKT